MKGFLPFRHWWEKVLIQWSGRLLGGWKYDALNNISLPNLKFLKPIFSIKDEIAKQIAIDMNYEIIDSGSGFYRFACNRLSKLETEGS